MARVQVQCEGGKMMLSAELAGKSGAMVFRQEPKVQAAAIPHPQFTLYGLSPVFEVTPASAELTAPCTTDHFGATSNDCAQHISPKLPDRGGRAG